jgi:membrane-bound lytic murein transglycosylase B
VPVSISRFFRPAATALCAGILATLPLGASASLADKATDQPATVNNFETCKADLQQQAIAAGVSAETARSVLAGAEYLERVIELDRRQPEFTTPFADYLNRRVNDTRIDKGRQLLIDHADLLQRVTDETGVPAAYLLSFWGMETNYGSYFGKMSVPSSLATLACDERRKTFFTRQLIAALQIVDEGAISPEQMEGSWAGAMGHVQFMPTVFLKHAVDADGDGRRDLWNSLPDALMSAGQFLQSMGWDGDYRWGREVQLPDNFNFALADGRRKSLEQWNQLGVTDASGGPLAQEAIDAAIIVPAGHQGPAFLAYHNFKVIMGWNRSEFYAIAVGHLADRIAGAGGLQNPPPVDAPTLSRDNILQLQQQLEQRGYSAGAPDGIMGPATRGAIRQYQIANDLVADGYPGPQVLRVLQVTPAL